MRLTDEEQTGVWAAPDPTPTPDPLSGGAWPAAQTTGPVWDSGAQAYYDQGASGLYSYDGGNSWVPKRQNDYSADPGLGVYGDQGGYSAPSPGAWPQAQAQVDATNQAALNTQQQAGYGYLGDYGGSGTYQEPGTGNVWNNGHWWTADGSQLYDDASGSWLTPAQYNDYKSQQNDYANAQANPQFQPTTYQQPGGDWYNYDNQAPQNYNLVGQGLDQIATTNPQPDWMGRFGGAYGGTSALDKLGTLGGDALTALQAPQQYVGGPIAQAAWDNPGAALSFATNPIGGIQSLALGAATNPQGAADTYQGAYQANQDVLNNPNMNPFLKEGYRTLTDPLSYAGPSLAAKLIPGEGAVPGLLRGAIDQGGIGAVLGGNLGGVAGASDAASKIPYFGDQPAWLRGLETGVGGAIAGAGIQHTITGNLAHGGVQNPLTNDTGEAFSTGVRKNVPDKTVIPDGRLPGFNSDPVQQEISAIKTERADIFATLQREGRQATPAEYDRSQALLKRLRTLEDQLVAPPGEPQALADQRLWFHSTRDMKYDLPDPDAAVGTQTGITQGPGVYMAADPAKSAGNYGNRTFVTEFDGNKVLDLTKQMTPEEPVFAGGPTWNKIRDDLAVKVKDPFTKQAITNAFEPLQLDQAGRQARAELANWTQDGIANGYVYKQALINALEGGSPSVDSIKPLMGRFQFKGNSPTLVAHSAVQNHLADEGVDALFHHSPRADGDVLIVLNGKAARVVADVKNAPDAVKAGATLKDIKRGAISKVVGSGSMAGPNSSIRPDQQAISFGGKYAGIIDKDVNGGWYAQSGPAGSTRSGFATPAEAKAWLRTQIGESPTSIRSFGSKIKDESGSASLSGIAQGAKDVAGFAAPIATRTALGAGVGAAYGEASGMGWQKGATIGAGVGLGLGVLGKVAGAAASRGVEARLAKNPAPEATGKLTALIKEAVPVREQQQKLYSQELGKRSGNLAKIQAQRGGESGFYQGMGALKGELPKATFTPTRPSMTGQEITDLFNHINDQGNMLPFTKMNAQGALVKVLAGELPTRSEISLLGKAFGEDFANALLSKRTLGAKAWENVVDAANLPRTLMTSWDASAPLRQGAILFAGHPIAGAKATGTMIRAMASPKFAELVKQNIETSPNATMYEKMGLYFADTSHSAALSTREEAIMSRIAGKIPGVGGSQRGYTTFLNKLRQDVADNFIAGHPNLSNQELKDFGHVINIMSGRGDLPKFLSDNSAILNAAFAPRYAMSRLQLPVEMVKAALPGALGGTTGAASKELARDVTAFVATGTTILTLGKLAGVWNVELDPRSTDFGKGKMGNTRFDFWAGEQQIARYAAQLVGDPTRGMDSLTTGQRKTSTGQIVDANRLSTIGRWLQTKKSPAVGFATDLLQGKDFVGQPLDLKTKEGIGNQAWQRLAPLFLQDMADAAKLSGNQWKALSAAPSAFGAGVQTYQDSDYKKREDLSKQMNGVGYYDATTKQQQAVDDAMGGRLPYSNPEVQKAVEKATTLQQGADTELTTGTVTPQKASAWRDQYNANKDNLRFFKDQVYADAGSKPGKDPILDGYYKAIDAAVSQSGKVNWDQVDAYMNSLSSGDRQYIKDHTGKLQIDTPVTRAFEEAKTKIEDSGFFDKKDKSWQAIQAQVPQTKGYNSYYDWYAAMLEEYQKAYKGQYTPEYIDKEARKALEKSAVAKGMAQYDSTWENQWIQSNPAAAYQAWHWGYWTPTEAQAKWLNAAVGAR